MKSVVCCTWYDIDSFGKNVCVKKVLYSNRPRPFGKHI